MDRKVVDSIERIFAPTAKKRVGYGPQTLSGLAIETNRDINILQDQVDKSFKRATEKTLSLKMTE